MENKLPDVIICSKCQRPVDVEIHIAFPENDTPKEIITQIFEPNYPYFSVQCNLCGQYSVFSPFAHDGHGS
jgi:hypothetical protein